MYFEDIKLGHTMELSSVRITKSDMLAFAQKYDNIPLHTDEDYAKTTHFGALVAPGVMAFMSVWMKFLEVGLFGTDLIAGKSTKIEWVKPTFADDILTGTAEVTKLTKRNEKNGIVEITVSVRNQHGALVLTDVTESVVKCRPAL